MRREVLNTIAIVAGVMALGAGGPWLARELRDLPRARTLASRGDQRVVVLEVGGMTCGGCAAAVQSRLAQVPGVSTVDVRYKQRRAYVVCTKSVADTTLTAAVERAGPGFLGAIAER